MLYGLILSGGRSTRMKKDKSELQYHGIPQTQFAYDLLKEHCAQIYLSNRKDQADSPAHNDLPQIHDHPDYTDIGPLGGILSAMKIFPQCAWFVLACDLPFIDTETITNLLDKRNPSKLATAYISAHDGFPEPLCAIYEPAFFPRLLEFLERGIHCPRKIMRESSVELVELKNKKALDNINTVEEFEEAMRDIS